MLEFVYLWFFLLLPLPLIARYFLTPKKRDYTQVWIPLAQGLTEQQSQPTKSYLSTSILWLAWLLLLIALAKPIWFGDPIRLQQEGRDMVLSLDLSDSMMTKDMPLNNRVVTRLTLVKSLLKDFIEKRKGDRLGLILFADHAYLQTPLTFDLKTIKQMVDETQRGLVGQSTAIGESIAMAIKRFVEHKNKQRVMILLTDGRNTPGTLDPIKAAKQAAKNNITIYTIGIGRRTSSARLDEQTLTEIAQLTNGQYFRARNQQQLQAIYQKIDQLEPISSEFQEFRPEKDLYYWPLSAALLLIFFSALYFKMRGIKC